MSEAGEAVGAASPARRRKVVMLPPISWLPARRRQAAQGPDQEPDLSVLERSLEAHGYDVLILDPMQRPWNPLHGKGPVLQGIDPVRTMRVLLFHRDAAAIVCVFEGPALLPALLRRLFLFRSRLLVWDVILGDWRLRQRMQALLAPRVDAVMVLGSNQVAAAAAAWDRHAPVRCIGHYLDTGFWRPVPEPYDLPEQVPEAGYILSVGDDATRDYPLFLRAVAGLGREVVVRSGQDLPGDGAARVRHIRGRIPFTQLRALYAGAAVVVVPLRDSTSAGGVTALLEAYAVGCAVVASRSAGVGDWLLDEETCLAVPCGDAGAMTAAVQQLLGQPALRARLGAGARAFVERCCSPVAFAARMARELGGEPVP